MKNLALLSERRRQVPILGGAANDDVQHSSQETNTPTATVDVVTADVCNTVSGCTAVLTNTGLLTLVVPDDDTIDDNEGQNDDLQNNTSNISTNSESTVGGTVLWQVHLKSDDDDDDADDDDDDDDDDVESKAIAASSTLLSTGWFDISETESSSSGGSGQQLVALNSETGAIVSIDSSSGAYETVGEFDHGILAAAWNTTHDVLVLVTTIDNDEEYESTDNNNNNNGVHSVLIAMNTDFDVLAEVHIEPIAVNEPVSISWRNVTGDSSVVVVSSVDADANDSKADSDSSKTSRKIRIYDVSNDLVLLHIGRTEDGSGKHPRGLVSPICYGESLIATIQRKSRKTQQVAFLEPNGLRHREFVIRSNTNKGDTVEAIGIDWNADSTLLLLTLRQSQQQEQVPNCQTYMVQIWYRCNYHWYMKQELRYNTTYVKASFDSRQPTSIRVLLDNGRYVEYTYRWDVSSTTMQRNNDTYSSSRNSSSMSYVIDGDVLNSTDFNKAIVPPPMYANTITVPNPISDIIVCCQRRQKNNPAMPSSAVAAPELSNNELEATSVILMSDGTLGIVYSSSQTTTSRKTTKKTTKLVTAVWDDSTKEQLVQHNLLLRSITIVGSGDGASNNKNVLLRLVAAATSTASAGLFLEISMTGSSFASSVTATIDCIHTIGRRHILSISPWLDDVHSGGALIQLDNGTFMEYNYIESDQSNTSSNKCLVKSVSCEPLPEPCPWIAAVKFGSAFLHDEPHLRNANDDEDINKSIVVGMSPGARLYYRDMILSNSISSFQISLDNEFLCFITAASTCVLRFVPLRALARFDPLLGSDDNAVLQHGYEPRKCERGSRLVAVASNKPQAVLQMPRGNLEVICPRALVLRHCMMAIQSRQYDAALAMMRVQKVDLNLIVDMNPLAFISGQDDDGATVLIEQIKKIDHLNLFISGLQNWNSTEDRYPIPSWINCTSSSSPNIDDTTTTVPFDFSTKINQVCTRLRDIMVEATRIGHTIGGKSIQRGHFILPILSTFAKQDPPQLHEALALIKEDVVTQNKDGSNSGYTKPMGKPALFSDTIQDSIQYLAFLADYEMLFRAALESYDFEMARAVARNSQMDPKVYLPQLKRYSELPENFGRCEVDLHLKRYDHALRNLSKSRLLEESITSSGGDESKKNEFSDCMKLIQDHKLHVLGLELFGEATQRNEIMISLGKDLMDSNEADTALAVFLAMEPRDDDLCMTAARQAKQWAAVFALLPSDEPAERRQILAQEIAAELVSSADVMNHRRHELLHDASRVLLDYASDISGAVDMLNKAYSWKEALRLCHLHSRADLARRVVDAALAYAETALTDFVERADEYTTTSTRYLEVLRIRKDAYAAAAGPVDGGGEMNAMQDNDDTGSLFSAASNASNLSLMSNTSTSSTASSASLSSVISVKSNSTFALSGDEFENRHKSRFNKFGGKKKRKKKKNKGSSRIRHGSEEDFVGIVQTMKYNCVDKAYCAIISDTIVCLLHNQQVSVGRELYEGYIKLSHTIESGTNERVALSQQEQQQLSTRHDGFQSYYRHPLEDEVHALSCEPISVKFVISFFDKTTTSRTTN